MELVRCEERPLLLLPSSTAPLQLGLEIDEIMRPRRRAPTSCVVGARGRQVLAAAPAPRPPLEPLPSASIPGSEEGGPTRCQGPCGLVSFGVAAWAHTGGCAPQGCCVGGREGTGASAGQRLRSAPCPPPPPVPLPNTHRYPAALLHLGEALRRWA